MCLQIKIDTIYILYATVHTHTCMFIREKSVITYTHCGNLENK